MASNAKATDNTVFSSAKTLESQAPSQGSQLVIVKPYANFNFMPNNDPTLLGMSAEIRNMIYRYTLVVPGKRIDVNDPRILNGDPGLLSTCTQIRDEASSIYFVENKFFFEPHMLEGTKALRFTKRMLEGRKDGKVVLPAELGNHPDFWDDDNFARWLRSYYEDPLLTPILAQDTPADKDRFSRTMIVRCFGIVDGMRHKRWIDVESVLLPFFSAIEHFEEFRMLDEDADSDSYAWNDSDEENEDHGHGNHELFNARPEWPLPDWDENGKIRVAQ